MTTIAWDGKTLAGDRMTHMSGTPICPTRKVFKVRAPNGRVALVGYAGNLAYCTAFRHWLMGGEVPPESNADQAWTILLIDDTRIVWYRTSNTGMWDRFGKTRWAIGSGCDYALGAMAADKSAREAVLIASRLDNQTGFGVDVVRF